jgi:hypothetical protein
MTTCEAEEIKQALCRWNNARVVLAEYRMGLTSMFGGEPERELSAAEESLATIARRLGDQAGGKRANGAQHPQLAGAFKTGAGSVKAGGKRSAMVSRP